MEKEELKLLLLGMLILFEQVVKMLMILAIAIYRNLSITH